MKADLQDHRGSRQLVAEGKHGGGVKLVQGTQRNYKPQL